VQTLSLLLLKIKGFLLPYASKCESRVKLAAGAQFERGARVGFDLPAMTAVAIAS